MRQADELAAPKTKGEQNSLARDESGASRPEKPLPAHEPAATAFSVL